MTPAPSLSTVTWSRTLGFPLSIITTASQIFAGCCWCAGLFCLLASISRGALSLPALFSDHMVLQRGMACPVWGWDEPGTKITVIFGNQHHHTVAGDDGRWTVKLDPMEATATPQALRVHGSTDLRVSDVLVGEVWVCSGQSNMERMLPSDFNGDLATLAANNPQLRLIHLPNVGSQEPRLDFNGAWTVASPQSTPRYTAIGYYFGDYLQRILQVPVGLIDNSWGGSTAEAWIDRQVLAADPRFQLLLEWTQNEETYLTSPAAADAYELARNRWQTAYEAYLSNRRPDGPPPPPKPASPADWLQGNHRAGNLFAGILNPILGYGIKGVIWYQGEGNTPLAAQYADLFPLLIRSWRQAWGQGDFPFYWAQLADFRSEADSPGESEWAELREAQTRTLELPHTGQAVIIDLGEGRDIHPRRKHEVAARLARIALARDYGFDLRHRSPTYREHRVVGEKIVASVDCHGSALRAYDTREVFGFFICGPDRVWHHATARLVEEDSVEVWSPAVSDPIAIRYAWADNPVCNLQSHDGLPLTPFRTDDFALSTFGKESPRAPFAHP